MSLVSGDMIKMVDLAQQFTAKGAEVAELRTFLQAQVDRNDDWRGQAADRFRELWTTEFAPALANLDQALEEASAEVKRRQQMLEEAGSVH
ncbi:MAG: WXG100 family type VII secretion target [Acidimicrobiia bacterium]